MRKSVFVGVIIGCIIVLAPAGKKQLVRRQIDKKISRFQEVPVTIARVPVRLAADIVSVPPKIVVKTVNLIVEEMFKIFSFQE